MKKLRRMYIINSKKIGDITNTPLKNNQSLHKTLKWVLLIAQCFGQFPVIGIMKPESRSLKYTWKSWRNFYSVINALSAGFLTLTYIYFAALDGLDLYLFGSIAFHLCALTITMLFMKLATEWPQLMKKWHNLENNMQTYGWPQHLLLRINLMSAIILLAAVVEYTMVKITKVLLAQRCKNKQQETMEYYFTVTLYPHIFSFVKYSAWKGFALQLINVLTTFAWTYNDLFIMLISTAISLRFQQITKRLRCLYNNTKGSNINIWRQIREDYNKLCRITRDLDEALSYNVLTSFISNLYFILVQLFNSLRPRKDTLDKVYFYFSFGFLIFRTICVSLYGAWIYDESKEPISLLNSVPSEIYNIEVKRFIEQIKFDTIALTGKRFFYVTRGIILSMTGAIVTYELVIMQFNQNLLSETVQASNGSGSIC